MVSMKRRKKYKPGLYSSFLSENYKNSTFLKYMVLISQLRFANTTISFVSNVRYLSKSDSNFNSAIFLTLGHI